MNIVAVVKDAKTSCKILCEVPLLPSNLTINPAYCSPTYMHLNNCSLDIENDKKTAQTVICMWCFGGFIAYMMVFIFNCTC